MARCSSKVPADPEIAKTAGQAILIRELWGNDRKLCEGMTKRVAQLGVTAVNDGEEKPVPRPIGTLLPCQIRKVMPDIERGFAKILLWRLIIAGLISPTPSRARFDLLS